MSPFRYYIFTSSLSCALYFCLVYFIRATYLNGTNVGWGLFSENNVLVSHVFSIFCVGIDQHGAITLPLLISRGYHYIYLLSETCIILASTSSQRYQLLPLVQEHAVLISTYVQHYHRDSAEHSYYPCGRVEIKLETVRMPTASSSGKHQRGFTRPTNPPPKKHLQIVWGKHAQC